MVYVSPSGTAFLKDADPLGFENVKSDEFLTAVVTTFWERYGGKTYE